ncbi:DUF2382 domain-containing protein [Quadrisphaera sp. DSM 44207]|uniref:DUF2382 domain-containing protein n=1 Tax=Quadrisphaera sp. DSM 44207 TaxID=1881057 RepID=UPI0008867456|nr:PRC and DUF2382 domain-containing protein [Quadrisphaera sp. DSM 44207]SDQ64199.1 conserved domain-containing protein [Quadrisphaera sp. DSM 44207]
MAVSISDPAQLRGATAYGSDGDKLGKVDEVFLDDATGQPEWAAVKTGLFGSNHSLVPLEQATFSGDELRVPYTKEQVKAAPNHDIDQALTVDDEAELYRHYGLAYTGAESPTGTGQTTGYADTAATTGTAAAVGTGGRGDRNGDGVYDDVEGRAVGRDTSGPVTDDAMTRSEERLQVGKVRTEAGRARLRKYIVTENVTQTVPVTHEEVVVQREPITDATMGRAMDGPALSEEEHEVTLHAERVVVDKDVVPVERVRLGTQQVTEEQTVTEQVRKEQIELEKDVVADPNLRNDRR